MDVSIIIPTYNSSQFLAAAIDSVFAQTFNDFEVLVIDDGSTDNTSETIKQYRDSIRYIWQENSGVSVARNNGIKESKGRYVAFLDADDTWFPNKLERQIAEMKQNPERKVCYSDFQAVDEYLKPFEKKRLYPKSTALVDLLTQGNLVGSICTVLCERTLFDVVDGFDSNLSQCADWDLLVRLAMLTDFIFIDEKLVTYRHHETNMSRNAALLERDSTFVLEKSFSSINLPTELISKRNAAFARNYMKLAGTYYHAGQYKDFLRCVTRSLSLDIKQIRYLLSFPFRALKVSA